jgi:hypothetical protein
MWVTVDKNELPAQYKAFPFTQLATGLGSFAFRKPELYNHAPFNW